jgi:hypothetical protein
MFALAMEVTRNQQWLVVPSLNHISWPDVELVTIGASGGCWIGNSDSCTPDSNWTSFGGRHVPDPNPHPFPMPPPSFQNFSDSNWKSVNTPYDFQIDGNYSANNSENNGYLPRNVSWSVFRLSLRFKNRVDLTALLPILQVSQALLLARGLGGQECIFRVSVSIP